MEISDALFPVHRFTPRGGNVATEIPLMLQYSGRL